MPHDLAAILVRRIEQIFADIRDPNARRRHLEEFLRDELDDIARQIAADRSKSD